MSINQLFWVGVVLVIAAFLIVRDLLKKDLIKKLKYLEEQVILLEASVAEVEEKIKDLEMKVQELQSIEREVGIHSRREYLARRETLRRQNRLLKEREAARSAFDDQFLKEVGDIIDGL